MIAPPDEPQPTSLAPPEELLELTHGVQRELKARGESLSTEWVEQSARDLKDGSLSGWYFPQGPGEALGFYSLRPDRAFGHVHVVGRDFALDHAERLVRQLCESLPPSVRTIDIGFTGLLSEEEFALWQRLRVVPGSASIQRCAMERPILSRDAAETPRVPLGCKVIAPRAIELDALADLDWNAFRGSADETLLGSDRGEYRRVLSEILAGRLGRFLEEASTGLVDDEGRLIAALLTGEESTRRGIFLDLMVDPPRRRLGVATFLVLWGCRALWALGYASVRLWVTRSNIPAMKLYAKLGFQTTSTALIYRWSHEDDVSVSRTP